MLDPVTSTLREVTAALPGGGEVRAGQEEMAAAVARAAAGGRHLVVQAGTGTGKSLAYLVPAAQVGGPTVVATATKALQDQLADRDLPSVAAGTDVDLTFAVLKGRSNYLCRQRVAELDASPHLDLTESMASDRRSTGALGEQVRRLAEWAGHTTSGDRADLDFEPHDRAWAAVSTTARECPGAYRCPSGEDCFAEEARRRAAEADVVVVNTHLYGAHLASGGSVLPPHRLVVLDEVHAVEEVLTDCLGVEVGPGRFRALAATARALLDDRDDSADSGGSGGSSDSGAGVIDAVAQTADRLEAALRPLAGRRLAGAAPPAGGDSPDGEVAAAERDLGELLVLAAGRVDRLTDRLRQDGGDGARTDEPGRRARRDRMLLATGHLADDLARLTAPSDDEVAWVDDDGRTPSLRLSPVDVGPLLAEELWPHVTGVLTSATVPLGVARRLGLPAEDTDEIDVGSPFDYRRQAILYVARSLPDRRRPESDAAVCAELGALIDAAGGRTLALFTSWRAMRLAVEALRPALQWPILAQGDLPKPALVEAFAAEEGACLFATLGFWQGIDVPGPTLSLVTIDRIPFPRPDDPLLEARRERAGAGSFSLVDLPRAGTLLAQGAGRLIRSTVDRGVVAVLDSRLATARYRHELLARVPPMRRSVDRAEVEAFLRELRA